MADIEIEGPDGRIFAFPDGTDPAVMRSAMARQYAAPAPGPVAPAPAPAGDPAPLQVKVQAAPAPAAPVDPIVQTVRAEEERARAAGLPQQDPYQRQMIQGATMGWADEALAGLYTPIEMIKRGTIDPMEAYRYAKARQDYEVEDAEKRSGALGTAAEIAGGVVSGGNLYRAGATLAPAIASRLGAGLGGRAAGAAADGALYGALAGAGQGNSVDERLSGAATGAAVGGALGGALPLAGAAIGAVAAPLTSNVAARVNPQGFADRQIERAVRESRQTPQQVADRLSQAAAEGQPEYRLMDALDKPGRRAAYTVARNPGEGRQQMAEFLDQRQAGQGGRVAQAIEEGLNAPETANQATLRLQRARRAQDDAVFPALRSSADPVDVTPALAVIDSVLEPGISRAATPAGPLAADSIEAVLGRARNLLAGGDDVTRTNFAAVQRARDDVADAANKAFRADEGNKARLLREVRNALDAQMEQASAGYRNAMAQSAQAARAVDAVEAGSTAARRGRTEDKVAAFNALNPEQQPGFRVGYADPLIERAQRSAMGTDAARPLTSLAARTELPAFAAPGRGDQMMRRLQRESGMFRTRAEATGGSGTAENFADDTAFGIDPSILGRLLALDIPGAARNTLTRGLAVAGGNTASVRERLAERLLSGSPDEIRALLVQLASQADTSAARRAYALRSFLGGVTPETTRQTYGR